MAKNKATTKRPTKPQSRGVHGSVAPTLQQRCEIDVAALKALDAKGLYDFRDVVCLLGDVLNGKLNEPRFAGPAGDLLDTIWSFLVEYAAAAEQVAEDAKPATAEGIQWRHCTLLAAQMGRYDDLGGLAVKAARAADDKLRADRAERAAARAA